MNEVAKDFDELFVEFIEQHGVQIWPERNRLTKVITHWTVQTTHPFKQVTRETLKGAITKLAFELGDLKFKNGYNS